MNDRHPNSTPDGNAPSIVQATATHRQNVGRELGRGTGKEFVARVNLKRAEEQVRKMLLSADEPASEADIATAEYAHLNAQWELEQHIDEIDPALVNELDLFEVAGCIKWFDPALGYGFIVPDNGLADVHVSVAVLRAGGFVTAPEGARIHCQVVRRPRGLQAFRILSMDDSTAIHPSQLPQRTHVVVADPSDWEMAMVRWFNPRRGLGYFVLDDDHPEVVVHMETLRRFGFIGLQPGQNVEIQWGESDGRFVVVGLRPPRSNKRS